MDDARALAGRRWHIGSMNDGLFIIDRRPSPSNDHPVHEYRAGISPDLVLPLEGAASQRAIERAQAIVDAHNAAIDRLAAPEGVRLTRYDVRHGDYEGELKEVPDQVGDWVRHEDAAAALAAEKARADDAESEYLRVHNEKVDHYEARVAAEAERDALKAALASVKSHCEKAFSDADDMPDDRSPDYEVVLVRIIAAIDAALSKTQGGG